MAFRLFSPGTSLSHRMVHAGFWAFALRVVERLFGLSRTIILARLLSPEHFGLFGIAFITMLALETFSRTGFHPALIQKEGDIRTYSDIAWSVHIIRGFVLAFILFLMAPFVAHFYNEPSAELLIQAVAVCFIFKGLTNIGVVYFQKDIEFHKQFFFNLCGTLADLVVAILMALWFRNAWALLTGFIARFGVLMIASYLFHPYRPRFRINISQFIDLFRYGIWVLLTGIMIYIGSHGAGVIVGKVIGVTALGYYQLAYLITQSSIREVTRSINQVSFPAYARMQNDSGRMKEAYTMIVGLAITVSLPIATVIATLGNDITRVLLGEKWMSIVPALVLLSIAEIIRSTASTGSPLFQGKGIPRKDFLMHFAKAVTLLAFIYPLSVQWGISGAAFAMILSSISMFVVWHVKIRRQLELTFIDMGQVFGPPCISSMIMAGAIFLLKLLTIRLTAGSSVIDILGLVTIISVSIFSYIIAIILCQRIFPGYKSLKGLTRILFD